MIFVTVGTHEQQFNRLLKEVDELVQAKVIREPVIMQTGYSTYKPNWCSAKDFFTYKEMNNMMCEADMVICHGGPATFMDVLSRGKIPIVVPRLKKYGEHVNNHQFEFAEKVVERGYSIVIAGENEIENALAVVETLNNQQRQPKPS